MLESDLMPLPTTSRDSRMDQSHGSFNYFCRVSQDITFFFLLHPHTSKQLLSPERMSPLCLKDERILIDRFSEGRHHDAQTSNIESSNIHALRDAQVAPLIRRRTSTTTQVKPVSFSGSPPPIFLIGGGSPPPSSSAPPPAFQLLPTPVSSSSSSPPCREDPGLRSARRQFVLSVL